MAYQLNLNWPEFLEKYWQKQPVVLKNAFPNFVDPITPDELAGQAAGGVCGRGLAPGRPGGGEGG